MLAIVNITPDSFSDAGQWTDPARASEHAARCVGLGADAIDLGAESTRPGADPVPEQEQIRRLVPVVRSIRALTSPTSSVPITIDTTRAAVARAALDAGATAINDVSGGLDDPQMLALVAERGCGIVLMHRLRRPKHDRFSDAYEAPPEYEGGVLNFVHRYLGERLRACLSVGIRPDMVLLDPGLGFGKTVEQNLELIRGTPTLRSLARPILSGLSRKSFVGRLMSGDGQAPPPPERRLAGTIALTLEHVNLGASVLRVHDVGEVCDALRAVQSLRKPAPPKS